MNNRNNALPIAALAILVLGLIGWTVARQSGGKPRADEAVAAAAAEVVADDAVATTVQGMPRAPSQRSISPDDPGSVFAKPVDPARQQRENEATLARFERQHRAEPVDAAWASQAEPVLDRIVTTDGIVISNIDPVDYRADCRSESCRISAHFRSYADAQDWGSMYITMSGETFQRTTSMVVPLPDGGAELRIYGYRRR